MLGSLGDVIHDVVVRLDGPIRRATDTPSTIVHRRGGSAANVAVAAARIAGQARFIGQIGTDEIGGWLRDALVDAGVDCVGGTGGRSGTVVSLVDPTAERSMLTDRGSSDDLGPADPAWLDGLSVLHVPLYSLAGGRLAATTRDLMHLAFGRRIPLSIDASSTALIEEMGPFGAIELIASLAPAVLLVNEDEGRELGLIGRTIRLGAGVVVIKQGARPAIVRTVDGEVEVPVPPTGPVRDTTGAGDAFAAGFLLAWTAGAAPEAAALAGHRSAADAIARASAPI